MKTAFEILPHDRKFILVRQPSGLILFTGDTEGEVRRHFLKNKHAYISGAEVKQPWEITKDDWHDEHLDDRILRRKYPHWSEDKKAQFGIPRDSDVVHQEAVEVAVREGKPVPAEVLADYPELTQFQLPPPPKEANIVWNFLA